MSQNKPEASNVSVGVAGFRYHLTQAQKDAAIEKGKNFFLFCAGIGVIAGEYSLRSVVIGSQKVADVAAVVADKLSDVHTSYVEKVKASPTLWAGVKRVQPKAGEVMAEGQPL